MPLDLNELRELLAAINQTDIAELTLKSDDFELTVRRGVRAEGRLYTSDAAAGSLSEIAPALGMPPALAVPPVASLDRPPVEVSAASAAPPAAKNDRRLVEILSPMVGTFYRAPGPDEAAFVEVGDRVQTGQTVCIIEAMKLMNELESEVSGELVEILVQNGEPVEYGQPLMRLNPLS